MPKSQRRADQNQDLPEDVYERELMKISEEEIDLIELVQTVWDARFKIARIIGIFLFLGLLVAVLSPVEYETEAILMPETQAQSQVGGILQQYGGLLGLGDAGSMGQGGAITPQLYPNIVQSIPYQVELMNKPVYFSEYDTTVTPHQFYTEIFSPSIFGYIRRFTIGLPGQIMQLFRQETQLETPLVTRVDRDSILSLSKEQMETIKTMRERMNVISGEQGLLNFSIEFPDPQAASEIGQAGLELLKAYVHEYRTQKAMEDLEFVREQTEEARKRFEEAQNRLAEFRDSNVNIATAKAKTREQELQSQYDLAFDMYNSLNQRLEQAKLTVQEDAPVFSVLQPITVPLEKSSPRRLLILVMSGVLGVIMSLGWTLVQPWWNRIRERGGIG